ncbi:MAG TPA: UDP-N-acetylglucosamine 1-carboxyvinyltransferase [Spirochaetota bacterium]|nr:UDP-N-acetylglucosamine 1-carboxyvinyltransferase [Spirochaetota bacterium]HPD05002.1 UDP-N-acetylglucosamine 1-carboxyvinyltransferase [Spirochaetota bacterium]HQI37862.1 UDP-N-acetylglucosamine 1-carboxyvinyltransferase [Spirochaetota bacterium]HQK07387.1 UDP-N-acetylglucosamine 1-carboxyvinyltransferase [Spirochaetota bacterium]HRR60437.1 UDP-N-acetylglucosamine 1-carboxyvinyltransferase [Spirochaetota bacterium]
MDFYIVKGGNKLNGTVTISGAKNAALPIIVASLLAEGTTVLHNVPNLKDIQTILQVIECLGAQYQFDINTNTLTIHVNSLKNAEVPYDLVKTMRASIYVMGPLLARCGEADVSLPGGCAIGERPVDIHLSGFEALGTTITIEHGYIKARVEKLNGNRFIMRKVSVGATANIMMAAVLADGQTILENCAMEPDVVDLGNFLITMGAKIEGLGTERIIINGVKKLKPVSYSIIPDRIEAGTFLIAGAITRGNVTVNNVIPEHVKACIDTCADMGFVISGNDSSVTIEPSKKLQGSMVRTLPYPGFPTDLQAPIMSLMCTIPGISVIIETIFENRYTHVGELRRMGADIEIEGNTAIIKGGKQLQAAPVLMSDLRAGASLVLAALAARGKTEIRRIYHTDRGYENFEQKLQALGADIVRVKGGKP